jgi:hypothetical protein
MEIMEMTELSCTEALEWAGQWWQVFGWFGLAYGVEHHFQQLIQHLQFHNAIFVYLYPSDVL